MSEKTRIWSPIDYDKDGKQADYLRLPISTDLSAYGWIPIPVVCIRNGEGPTVLLIAGSHGDEYEGQIALASLARVLKPQDVKGRVIILPSLNFPAVQAGRRVSPIDEGNLNRVYPGKAHGSATEMIAHYITETLLPIANLVVDLHSGGRSLDYVPCALVRPVSDEDAMTRMLGMMAAFGAPISYITNGSGGGGNTTLPASAEPRGVPVITAELGGGATLSDAGKSLATHGVRRLLQYVGVLSGQPTETAPQSRLMEVPNHNYFLYADSEGLFEPLAAIGEDVREGQAAGLLHSLDHPTREPEQLYFSASGLVACRRFPTLTRRGDCLYGLMRDVQSPTRASAP
jgi:predicted deacylase